MKIYPGKNNNEDGFYAKYGTLMTWRPTYSEAVASIDEAIKGYLECAALITNTPEELKGMIDCMTNPQIMEAEADRDYAEGRYDSFYNMDDFIDTLV